MRRHESKVTTLNTTTTTSYSTLPPTLQQQQQRSRRQQRRRPMTTMMITTTTTTPFRRLLLRFFFLVIVIVIAIVPVVTSQETTDYSCTSSTESNCKARSNNVCNSRLAFDSNDIVAGCEDGDCIDCSAWCEQYHLDCTSCLEHFCYYCPGDGTCFNSPDYSFDSGGLANGVSCTNPSDYWHDSSSSSSSSSFFDSSSSNSNSNTCQENFDLQYFHDPLYATQEWIFDMIDVKPVWQYGYQGTGIRVRINDGGVNPTHVEFGSRFDINGSCTDDYYAAVSESSSSSDIDNHATAVAAIVGGQANNGECSVGT
jgi:hypothetical protein